MPEQSCAVAIMAKASVAGTVKTRLVPPLTHQEAAELNTCCLADIAANIAAAAERVPIQGFVAYHPARLRGVLRESPARTVSSCCRQRNRPSDAACSTLRAISLTRATLRSAWSMATARPCRPSCWWRRRGTFRSRGDRVVLGPAADGGYYLIGLKHLHQRLFEAIDWSTERVYRQTITRAGEIGVPVTALAEWYDVDDEASLTLLARELLCGPDATGCYNGGYAAPRTAALLERLAATNDAVRRLLRCLREQLEFCGFRCSPCCCWRARLSDFTRSSIVTSTASLSPRCCKVRSGPSPRFSLPAAPGARSLRLILATAVLLRLGALAAPVYLSDDIYRYIWDGRVQAAGINPYRYIPTDTNLAPLRDEAVFPNINRNNYAPTIYPPVAQMLFLGATRFGETVPAIKLVLVAVEAIGIGALLLVLRTVGAPRTEHPVLCLASAAGVGDRRLGTHRCGGGRLCRTGACRCRHRPACLVGCRPRGRDARQILPAGAGAGAVAAHQVESGRLALVVARSSLSS